MNPNQIEQLKTEYPETCRGNGSDLNREARLRIQCQISDRAADITQAVLDEIKTGLDMMEMARLSADTESMRDVAALLGQAAEKFDIAFHRDSKALNSLAEVAMQVYAGETETEKQEEPA